MIKPRSLLKDLAPTSHWLFGPLRDNAKIYGQTILAAGLQVAQEHRHVCALDAAQRIDDAFGVVLVRVAVEEVLLGEVGRHDQPVL